MSELTFRRYQSGRGPAGPKLRWVVGVPGDFDVPAVVAAAGFDPDSREAVRFAFLEAAWEGHPAGALLVAETPSLSRGDRYAVSDQPAAPPE